MKYTYLSKINTPADIKALNFDELNCLADEVRDYMLETVYRNGGHLSSNLGTVEITLALHRVFDSPKDKFIFDVGHQCYTHKLVTGRFKDFSSLRRKDGLSGFCSPKECEHDHFYSGHSGTALSSSLGLSAASCFSDEEGYVISVLGDGSFSCGMTYEALNHSGARSKKHIIILNDNGIFISEGVGAFSELRDKKTFFEIMGYKYIGIIDGHSIEKICDSLIQAKENDYPTVIHMKTVKGKGFDFSERQPELYHGISCSDSDAEDCLPDDNFSEEYGKIICDLAEKDKNICAVTAAMKKGTALESFSEKYPDRFFDVGIAEQHGAAFCTGLARKGMKPVFAIYSTFLQRCYDQLIHDVALQGQRVVFVVDRAGFVGEDGVTHQGIYDVGFLNTVPDVEVYSPCSYNRLREILLYALYEARGSTFIRYPRAAERKESSELIFNNGISVYGTGGTTIITYGSLTGEGVKAVDALKDDGYQVRLISLEKLKPLPEGLVDLISCDEKVYFFEEGQRVAGIGERIGCLLAENGFMGKYKIIAVEDTFVNHAEVQQLLRKYNLDFESMIKIISGENQ